MFRQSRFPRKVCALLFLCSLLGLSLVACSSNGVNPGNINAATPTQSSTTNASTQTPASAPGVFRVTSVSMSVNPASLAGHVCGTHLTVTYTATFHLPINNPGGQVKFGYTTTNGRGSTQASLTVSPGSTSVAYHFTWSGTLTADHTAPGLGGVIVVSPNPLVSHLVAPSGTCSTTAPGAFAVTSIELTASPALTGHACGSQFTETYTATFHITPNSPGGVIIFAYTTNNGRSETNASLHVAAGQTTATYHFTWSGALPADHTAPGTGIILVTAPNPIESSPASPSGQCS